VVFVVQKDDSLSNKGLVKGKTKERDKPNTKKEYIPAPGTTPQHSYTNSVPTQSNFDDAEPVWTLIDFENTLSKGKHLSSPNKIATMKNVPFREGIGPPHTFLEPRAQTSLSQCQSQPRPQIILELRART